MKKVFVTLSFIIFILGLGLAGFKNYKEKLETVDNKDPVAKEKIQLIIESFPTTSIVLNGELIGETVEPGEGEPLTVSLNSDSEAAINFKDSRGENMSRTLVFKGGAFQVPGEKDF